ncbi:MAG: hypothetical protein ACYTEV_12460 [Planctomycetota bacterium]
MNRPIGPDALDCVVKLRTEHGTKADAAAFSELVPITMEARRDAAITTLRHERSDAGHRTAGPDGRLVPRQYDEPSPRMPQHLEIPRR